MKDASNNKLPYEKKIEDYKQQVGKYANVILIVKE